MSCTSTINAVEIPEEMMEECYEAEGNSLYICDTPGFGDNRGAEIDIANQIGTVDAIYQCSSIRILVVAPNSGFDINNQRCAAAFTLVSNLSQLFTNLSDIKATMTVYFNETVPINRNEVKKNIKNIISNKNQLNIEPKHVNLFNLMLKSTEN